MHNNNFSLETISAATLFATTGGAMSQTARDAVYNHYKQTWDHNPNPMSIQTVRTQANGWYYLVRQNGRTEDGVVNAAGKVSPSDD
jgi:hypothetical protein